MSTTHQTDTPLRDALQEAIEAAEAAQTVYDHCDCTDQPCLHGEVSEQADAALRAAREALRISQEPRIYTLRDGHGGQEDIRSTPSAIEDDLRAWIEVGEWGDGTETVRVHASWSCAEDGEEGTLTVTIEADEPDCVEDHDHDWQSPYHLLGGLRENPGVWGHGGGIIARECCAHCGAYRVTDTWAQDMETGTPGLQVSYQEADDESRAWLAVTAIEPVRG